ncbi:PAC2 family protein [Microbacterium sp. cx-55]|uniref:proteasome assembly chaperone family protein n=1 Tax=unclassified Microbacterium TaxID=2609290 RepID=UPI001CBBDC2D|nr:MULTISPECIES: PAC2 family protein [unclassified Microbacterium]MBZ4486323.1 PAC2 family protein [Microbacterium sp. cx-55]MCC4907288.1 PAC2 family protein [Microbacterium sp. cx-59]UGB33837.1 PAC2 family protein [Microbacterium sp. cx-55]
MPWNPSLYADATDAPPVPVGLPLVVMLTGFTDAGSAVSQTISYLRDELSPTVLRRYENDLLLDYRARRPTVAFEEDHLTDYIPPRLELALAHDALGQPFLVLTGYEPDFAWEAFTASVVAAAAEYSVATVTWVHSIGMPVPHTRPLGATVSGTRAELAELHSVWKPRTQVPATAGHLLEYRLAEAGAAVAGFVLLVPHYLGDAEYPASAIAALDSVTAATGLVFTVDDLRADNEEFLGKVSQQIEASDELTTMLQNLEERYDAYMAGATQASPLLHEADLPSADEIAAELEKFLATGSHDDDSRGPAFG